MAARFEYTALSDGVLRPIVPIVLAYGNRWVSCGALIDSGADISMFDMSLAEPLGLDLSSSPVVDMIGIAPTIQSVRLHEIDLRLAGRHCRVLAGFADLPGHAYGYIGQRGFFDRFVVTFDRAQRVVQVS